MGRGTFPAATSQPDVLQGEAHLLDLAHTHKADRALARGIGTGAHKLSGGSQADASGGQRDLGEQEGQPGEGSEGSWPGGRLPGERDWGMLQAHSEATVLDGPWEQADQPGRESAS